MKKTLLALIVILLNGCAIIQSTGLTEIDPTVTTQRTGVKKEFDSIPAPANGKPVSVAVYSFADKTGQRRPQPNVASLSTAVTQGAETFLIQALQNVGGGKWFEVVERVGIDNLTKERTIIRQMREAYEGANAKPLMPMQFAGMILEGGLVGYDTSTNSGGAGMRIFGIGKQTQWSQDTVTVSLRAVSVNTGKVLASVTVQKTILSTADSMTALKFFDAGTKAFEAEAGLTINEPGTYAVKSAVEMAVVELIKEGVAKGIWEYKEQFTAPVQPAAVIPDPKVIPKAPVISSEIKKEEKKDVVVQPQAVPEAKTETLSTAPAEVKVEKKAEVKPVETKIVQPVARSLFGQRKLKEAEFIYKDQDEKSQKTWQFKKGTVVDIRQVGSEGWIKVTDSESRGGWIRVEHVEEVK
jgi:curli production assembly/transport component CsgG